MNNKKKMLKTTMRMYEVTIGAYIEGQRGEEVEHQLSSEQGKRKTEREREREREALVTYWLKLQ
jgi:hypothetical protein